MGWICKSGGSIGRFKGQGEKKSSYLYAGLCQDLIICPVTCLLWLVAAQAERTQEQADRRMDKWEDGVPGSRQAGRQVQRETHEQMM